MINRFKSITLMVVLGLALFTVACQGEAGSSLRLPTAVPPTPVAQAPQGQAPAQPPAAPQPAAPKIPAAMITPVAKATVVPPQNTPLPAQLIIGGPSDPNPLRRPMSLALIKGGGIYVGDQIGIHQYDANGKYVKTLLKSGPDTGLKIAAAMAISPSGDLFVADTLSNLVLQLKPDGTIVAKLGENEPKFDGPVALEFDTQGNLYVVNQNSAEIYKLDPSGKLLAKIGSKGEQNGQFLRPRGIALDKQGNLFVTDLTTYLIQKFGPDGKYIRSFGNQRSGENGWFLRGITVGADGRLYVVDGAQQRIQVFNISDFTLVKEFQNPGREPGQLQDPEDMHIDEQGNLYIADKGNNRVQKIKLPL